VEGFLRTTKNQIDPFLICLRWRTSLKDVRSFRGAEVGSGHELVVARLKLELKSYNQDQKTHMLRSLDIDNPSEKDVQSSFRIKLSNKIEIEAKLSCGKRSINVDQELGIQRS
jgi:hypothetical protein